MAKLYIDEVQYISLEDSVAIAGSNVTNKWHLELTEFRWISLWHLGCINGPKEEDSYSNRLNRNVCWTGYPFVYSQAFFSYFFFLLCVYLLCLFFSPLSKVHISFYIYSITCLLSNVIVWNVCEMEKL